MSQRVSGYRYVVGKDGKKHRVYNKAISGRGAYVAPVPRALRGRGGYYDSGFVKTMRKWVPKGTLAAAGGAIGGMYGRPDVGAGLGLAASKILGFGAYKVKRNSMIDEGQSPANMHSTNSTARIRHREYICDIVSSATANTFQSQVFNINPGLENTFPWLAPVANQYEQYEIKGMVFEFKSLYADAIASSAANSTLGGVVMSTNYNSVAAPWTSKQQMENTEFTTSAKPSISFYHPIECAPNQTTVQNLYVRSAAPPLNADLRMYDMGLFQIATFGIASASVVVGELWCTYEVELYKPIAQSIEGQNVQTDMFDISGTINNTNVFGTVRTLKSGSSIGGDITANNVYNFPDSAPTGYYFVSLTGDSTTSPGPSVLTSISAVNGLQLVSGTTVKAPTSSISTTGWSVSCVFKLVSNSGGIVSNPGFSFNYSALPTTDSAKLIVAQIDGNLSF